MGLFDSSVAIAAELPPGRVWQYAHGEHCACVLLAAAVGAGPDAVSCEYCRHVLQKHWQVACDHGGKPPRPSHTTVRWRDMGQLDEVKAMLIKEA